MSGFEFKTNVMPSILKSHCFTINFDAENNTFTVTSYGGGICVGMSQAGANYLAGNGSDYKTILSTYYKKADLVKEENI